MFFSCCRVQNRAQGSWGSPATPGAQVGLSRVCKSDPTAAPTRAKCSWSPGWGNISLRKSGSGVAKSWAISKLIFRAGVRKTP